MQKRAWLLSMGALLGACLTNAAWAQSDYPNRPITLIVPYGAGGVTDVITRSLAQAMSLHLKQPIVIENKPGAGASMGVLDMKTAKPDGYRLTLTPAGIFRQPYIQKVNYDPVNDLSFISAFMEYDFILAVPPKSPFQTVSDLVAHSKKEGGSIDYGSAGRYSGNHVTMALLEQRTGAQFIHVPYKGDAEATNALLAEHNKSAVFGNTVLPYLTSGKLRALAIASPHRAEAFPNVPTFKEQGYDIVVPSPLGFAGPRGLTTDVIRKLEEAVQVALKDKNFQQTAANYGIRTQYLDNKAYTALAHRVFSDEKAIIASIGLE
ncbi:Bug family tripartite tricarboxylate transporter substrate binding protein [Comamonas sp.]